MIHKKIAYQILLSGFYPDDARLSTEEIVSLYREYDEGMKTTNGDTSVINVTGRQLAMMLSAYLAENSKLSPTGNYYILNHEDRSRKNQTL